MLFMDASRSKQRAVVRFLVAEGERNVDIYRRMVAVYGEFSLGQAAASKWCKSFREGWQTISDLSRPSQANFEIIIDDSTATFDAMFIVNRRVRTLDM
ncbi:uncharacterized protein NPIL_501161 [Nephila pilipes]|uniref:Mos1 transposase HTH domain-containing protein n=1 Tax=Nephila pilipes TaxID=299642 RepID=A0A8X6PW54_NEPPI|nr:uncharacterized protein NPIL_501161 [Nephila pilipes]